MIKISQKYRIIFVYVVLAIATLGIYWQVRQFEFISFDDNWYIYLNEYVKGGLTWESFQQMLSEETEYTGNWHPVTSLSHMLDYELYELEAGGHHFTSLVFHIANTLLLLLVLHKMTRNLWSSVFVAALFALHPLHVESVAWASERKDVLSTFFWFLTMLAYVHYTSKPGIVRYLLTLFFFAIGLMSKPMLVTLPFVLLLLDYWPLNRLNFVETVGDIDNQEHKLEDRVSKWSVIYRLVIEKIPFFVFSLISCIITFRVQQSSKAVAVSEYLPLKFRIFNVGVSYVKYIWQTIYPRQLAFFYPHPGFKLPLWQPIVCFLILALISLCSIYAIKRRYIATGWFWFIGTLVPVIGLIQVGKQATADRYTYVPLTGLFIIAAWGVPEVLARLRYRKLILASFSVIILFVLSFITWHQAGYWRNDITLYKHATEAVPNNILARESLGRAYLEEGKFKEASKQYKEILRIRPDSATAQLYLGKALLGSGEFDEAIKVYKNLLPEIPDVAKGSGTSDLYARYSQESAIVKSGKLDEMLIIYTMAHNNLGIALSRKGKFSESVKHFSEALRINPDFASAHANIGHSLLRIGKSEEAAKHFRESVRLNPNVIMAHYYLGFLLKSQGKADEAIKHFYEVLRLNPNWVEPMNNLAWLLATTKSDNLQGPGEAVKIALRACKLTNYQHAGSLDTLAVAYAAAGRFTEAIETAEKAINAAKSSNQRNLIKGIKKRLELYKKGQPCRESD